MTPSLRLLLEDFLGLMREEGELDVYLPLLLSSMGHELVYRAQKGPRQYGVDILSVGKDEDGKKKLFLWLVKCGHIGRRDWNSTDQSIRQSMDEIGPTYLDTHVAHQHARLPKKLVILTNGDFDSALVLIIATFLKAWSKRHKVEAVTVNGSTLAAWTERYLLDENVLGPSNRALFRRMLANVGSPELSISVGRSLLEELVKVAMQPTKSLAAQTKRRRTALRGIRTALSVLQIWAQNERNLLAPYRLAEFAVLSVWAEMHDVIQQGDRTVAIEFAQLLFQLTSIAETYHEQLQPYYLTQNGFAYALPDSLLVTDAVFQELGRLGLQGLICAFHATASNKASANGRTEVYLDRLTALLDSHSCTQSPAYDHHSVDIHTAMLLLLIGNRREAAKDWLRNLVMRLSYASKTRKFWPLSAPFEETLLIRYGHLEMSEEFTSTTTLMPILLLWSAALEMEDAYAFIRDRILPAIPKTTLNFWSCDVGFDKLVADPVGLHQHGVGESVMSLPANSLEFLTKMSTHLAGVESIEHATWYRLRAAYIPLLAALHWRLQIPREMLVKHSMAVAGYSVDTTASTS